MSDSAGLHHVTAIAGDPQRNLDFYAGVLGMRFVKRTVNFDDPQTYHFYFGDETGTPGTIMTFFPWPGARAGRQGIGQVAVTSFAIAAGALGFWLERLLRHGVRYEGPTRRGDGAAAEQVVAFRDPDGLMLELVASAEAERRPGWGGAAGVPREQSVRGVHAVTIWAERGDPTAEVLTGVLGFRLLRETDGTARYAAGGGGPGALVDLRAVGGFPRGVGGAGTIHHVAFRAAGDPEQLALRARALEQGLAPTPVIDRSYFRSVYFREPGGVLFEVATDVPGFAVDEPMNRLGERLMLPPRYEPQRPQIEAALPPIHLQVAPPGAALLAQAGGPEAAGAEALGFVHRHVPPAAGAELAGSTTLLLLHGTGGDENDLVPLGEALLPGAGLLSPRGRILERGAPRFFRRLAEGVFDQEDLARQTHDLAEFVQGAARAYELDRERIVAVGFSNGANIAASLLLHHPGLLRGALLLSPMVPFEPASVGGLGGTRVFIGAGRLDPISPPEQAERLAELLRSGGADVTLHWADAGHQITRGTLDAAREWIGRMQA